MTEDLERLSLLAFVDIANIFGGLYMTPHLRIWHIRVDVRLTPRLEFKLEDKDFDNLIKESLGKVLQHYRENFPEFLEEK